MFRIKIPAANNIGGTVVSHVEVTVYTDAQPTNASGVAFAIDDPRTPTVSHRFPADPAQFHPANSLGGVQLYLPVPTTGSPAPTNADNASVQPPTASNPLDPSQRRYKLNIRNRSDYNIDAGTGTITPTRTTDEDWQINLVPQATNDISSACVQSFHYVAAGSEALLAPTTGATIENVTDPQQSACLITRPPLDVVLVLDHSGSMSSSTTGASGRTKINALHDAVKSFRNAWTAVRATETVAVDDKVGVVIFDHTFEWKTTPAQQLQALTTAVGGALSDANIDAILPAGGTSIGRGLVEAAAALGAPNPNRRRVILLMSNGMQNTEPMVGVHNTPSTVFTSSGGVNTELPNQSSYRIYSVTVGTGIAVSPQINQDIATATKGFYTNTEIDPDDLTTFFVELLQNFMKFNSWETAKLASGIVSLGAPFATAFHVTSTTRNVQVLVSWPEEFGRLRVTVAAPGVNPDPQIGAGSVQAGFDLLELPGYQHLGEWTVTVEVPGSIDSPGTFDGPVIAAFVPPKVPIKVSVLVDDLGVNADLDVAQTEFPVGEPIQLRATLTELGQPVLGLGTRAGETVVARILKPGQSVGDLLASSEADAQPAPSPDPLSPAETKLFNELQKNPDAFVPAEDLIQLTDADGDGVYTGSYPTMEPGHYTFLFGVQGRTAEAGIVSRQQVKSVWVRPVPDPNATQISIDTSGSRLFINFTPKTKFGNLMGPGWANYFWFTTTSGSPAFKPVDNLNGSYVATLGYTGQIPSVSLHFIDESILITDDVTHDKLPVPLDDRTIVVPQIPGTGDQATGCLLIIVTLIQRILRGNKP